MGECVLLRSQRNGPTSQLCPCWLQDMVPIAQPLWTSESPPGNWVWTIHLAGRLEELAGGPMWTVGCTGQSCDLTPPCSSFRGMPLEAPGSPLQHRPQPCLPSPWRRTLRTPKSIAGQMGKGWRRGPQRGPSPHGGLVHQVLSLAVVLHVRVVGGEHGVKGEDLLLDGAAVRHLRQSTEAATGERPASPSLQTARAGLGDTGRRRGQDAQHLGTLGEAPRGHVTAITRTLPGPPHSTDA